MVKRLPAMQETRVQSLGWEDPLEKEMAAHSSILAWKIPWTVEPGRLPSMGSQRVGRNWVTSLSLSLFIVILRTGFNKVCKAPGLPGVTQMVKNSLAMQETWVGFLGREDPLEKRMATHSSIFNWRIPWTEESGRLQSMGLKESDTTEQLSTW